MIDPNILLPFERTTVIEFANAMRDIDTAVLLAKPTGPVGKSAKCRLWKQFVSRTDEPISTSYRALVLLRESDNQVLREWAEKSIKNDAAAMKDLRRLANRIRQDETPDTGRKEWTTVTQLN